MGSTLQPDILYTDTVVPGTALSKSLYSGNLLLSDEELFKVHIPPLTKFCPETPCGVKRSYAKNFRNRNCGFPTIKLF